MHNPVIITIDERKVTILPGTYGFSDFLGHVQLDKDALRAAGVGEEVIGLTVRLGHESIQVRGNDSVRIVSIADWNRQNAVKSEPLPNNGLWN